MNYLNIISKENAELKYLIAFLGFFPIMAIAAFAFGIIPLSQSAVFFVIPAYLLIATLSIIKPNIGKLVVMGWVFGVIAVTLYDMSRIPFILAGWDDFIPAIGNWLLETDDAHPIVGYSWRYIGNGGGMGIAFTMLFCMFRPKIGLVKAGTLYGFLIFLCLYFTLIFSPSGQSMMFEIKPLSFTGGLIGHLVYGFVLGLLLHKRQLFLRKKAPISKST